MKAKRLLCFILIFITVLPIAFTSSASTPYANYFMTTTGKWNLPIPAPYEVSTIIDTANIEGCTALTAPEDIFIDENGKLYITDTGNNRIVVLKPKKSKATSEAEAVINTVNFELDFIIKGDEADATDPSNLKQPKGVFVDDDGTIIVADTGNARLVEFTKYGNFRYSYPTPESELLGSDFSYQPVKVIKDSRGYIYVVSFGETHGVLLLSGDGEFKSYYAANKVSLGWWDALARKLWSRKDRMGTVVTLPYTFNNIYISSDGYVYATTSGNISTSQIRKINSAGSDVLYASKNFQDGALGTQAFLDVTVDSSNNMFIMDNNYGRIYEYDQWGRNLFVFGNNGVGDGQFSDACSMEVDSNGALYVMNRGNGTITVFKSTVFADAVHYANNLYSSGNYDDAYPAWEEVLNQNSYYVLALQAMGEIHHRNEDYTAAMDLFEKAEDATNYSPSFVKARYLVIKEYFSLGLTIIVLLFTALVVYQSVKKKRIKKYGAKEQKKTIFTPTSNFLKKMKRVSTHPIDGFNAIRYEGEGKYKDAFAIMIIYTIFSLLATFSESFIYRNGASLDLVKWGSEISFCLLPWAVACIVNYGVTTIMFGEGRLRDVVIGGAYCHVPLLFTQLPLALLTQVLSSEEKTMYGLAQKIILVWVFILVYLCIVNIHGFTPIVGFVVLILTAVGIAAVTALFMLFVGVASQMFDFFIQFAKELSYLV